MSGIGSRLRDGAAGVAGTGVAAAAVLALLAGAAAFGATAIPRQNARAQTSALHAELASAGPDAVAVTGAVALGDLSAVLGSGLQPLAPVQLARPEGLLTDLLTSRGVPLSADPSQYWSGVTTSPATVRVANPSAAQKSLARIRMSLVYRDTFSRQASMVAGAMAGHAATSGPGRPAEFDIAVSQATAAAFSLRPGQVLAIPADPATASPSVELHVTGIYRAHAQDDQFWTHDALVLAPSLNEPASDPPYWDSEAVIGPGELTVLQQEFAPQKTQLQYSVPLDSAQITGSAAQGLADRLMAAEAAAAALPIGSIGGDYGRSAPLTLAVGSGITQVLTTFLRQRQAVGSVVSLVLGSLAALGLAVLFLCVRLLGERRAPELRLLRARGASGRQLAALAARGGATGAVSAAAGTLLAFALIPGPIDPGADWRAGAVVAAAALLGPALLARPERGPRRRGGAAARRRPARRIVANTGVVVVSISAVVLLRSYGAGSSSLFASVTPFLLSVPIALALHHLVPLAVRALTRTAARGRGVVSFVGLAHAARGSAATLLPSFALVLTLAVVGVGSVVRATVLSGEQRGSWAAVGADDVVTAADPGHGFAQAAQRAVTAVPGVARSAAATAIFEDGFTLTVTGPGQLPSDTVVLIVDPGQYGALTAGTPAAQLPAGLTAQGGSGTPGTPIPVVVSAQVAAQISAARPTMTIAGVSFGTRVVAAVAATAALPGRTDFVIVPRWALQRAGAAVPEPNILLLDGSVDGAALAKTLASTAAGATVESRAAALDALTSAPFQSGTFRLLDLAMAAAAALGAGALLAGLALGAAAREQAAARLATMGLSRAQTDRLTLIEHLPSIAGALLGGAACTVAIGSLIGPGIDLSVFTGTTQAVPLRVDPGTLTAAGAAIAATAALALTGHALLTHHRGVTAALRIGEQ